MKRKKVIKGEIEYVREMIEMWKVVNCFFYMVEIWMNSGRSFVINRKIFVYDKEYFIMFGKIKIKFNMKKKCY